MPDEIIGAILSGRVTSSYCVCGLLFSRFVAAALAAYYIRPARASMTGVPIVLDEPAPDSPAPLASANPFCTAEAAAPLTPMAPIARDISGTSPGATGLPLLPIRGPSAMTGAAAAALALVTSKSLDQDSGEYRGIMSLCR
jgi:hypothetical protein